MPGPGRTPGERGGRRRLRRRRRLLTATLSGAHSEAVARSPGRVGFGVCCAVAASLLGGCGGDSEDEKIQAAATVAIEQALQEQAPELVSDQATPFLEATVSDVQVDTPQVTKAPEGEEQPAPAQVTATAQVTYAVEPLPDKAPLLAADAVPADGFEATGTFDVEAMVVQSGEDEWSAPDDSIQIAPAGSAEGGEGQLPAEDGEAARQVALGAVESLLTFSGDEAEYAAAQGEGGHYLTKSASEGAFNQPGFDPTPEIVGSGPTSVAGWVRTDDAGDDDLAVQGALADPAGCTDVAGYKRWVLGLVAMRPRTVGGELNQELSEPAAVADAAQVSGQAVVRSKQWQCVEDIIDVERIGTPITATTSVEYEATLLRLPAVDEGRWLITQLLLDPGGDQLSDLQSVYAIE